ncbi:polysaccharide biosynthesis C-terminal domain-containing protein [Alloalcanivorax marinus]|uniref:oligosaccharide flippase family protein n=1 Tax=Alloalcanivorax marinus TaxID=1177169 RepID=UPI0019570445|nr:polysaccharide biosynthesis C-terminal domain-containing protein [Alloalcanivorax marinus]MBM7333634.1 oligosaccharide flippase family protein [Alloalcanivorax marinus]
MNRNGLMKSFIGVGAMKMASIPLGVIVSIVLARSLSISDFGKYTYIMALLQVFVLPLTGGIPQLLTREVAGFKHEKDWGGYRGLFRVSHLWVAVFSIIIVLAFILAKNTRPSLLDYNQWKLLSIAILIIPVMGLNAVRNGIIKGLGYPSYSELPGNFIQPTVLLAVLFAFIFYLDLTVERAIKAQVISYTVTFFIATIIFLFIKPKIRKSEKAVFRIKEWGSALVPFTFIALMSTFSAQVGILLLGLLGTHEQVAAMRIGERGAQFVVLSLAIVNLVISPYIVKAFKSGNKKELQKLAKYTARGALFVAAPLAIVLIIFGKEIVTLLFGGEYAGASYWPLAILCVGQVVNVYCGSVGNLLSMSGHERDTLVGQSLSLIVSMLLCVILIPIFGAVGAATGVSIGLITWNILLMFSVSKRLGIKSSAF